MDKKTEHELENQDNWDYEHLETRGPVKAPRVVVSVAFRREDFENVAKYAERAGKKTSELIREAALEKVTGRGTTIVINSFATTGSLWFGRNLPSTTRVFALAIERETPEPVVTSA